MLRRFGDKSPLWTILLTATLTLALAWGATGWLLIEDSERAQRAAQERAQATADNMASHLGQSLAAYEAAARAAAAAYLKNRTVDLRQFEPPTALGQRTLIHVTDREGRVVRSSFAANAESADKTIALHASLDTPVAELTIGAPQLDPYRQAPIAPLLLDLVDPDKEHLGWIVVAVPLPMPVLTVSRMELGGEGFALIITRGGQFELRRQWKRPIYTSSNPIGAPGASAQSSGQAQEDPALTEEHPPHTLGERHYLDPGAAAHRLEAQELENHSPHTLADHHFIGTATLPAHRLKVVAALSKSENLAPVRARRQLLSATMMGVSLVLIAGVALMWQLFKRVSASERRMRRLASTDPVTRLPNRRAHLQVLARSLQAARQAGTHVGLLYVDVDELKQINKDAGHSYGDRVLRTVAQVLRKTTEEWDSVARTGGDGFAVVLNGLFSSQEVRAAAERVVRAVAQLPQPSSFAVRVSVGAHLCEHRESRDDVARKAETAMFAAKANGRNRVEVYGPEMDAQFHDRRELARELQQAIAGHQLIVVYRPKVVLQNRALAGYEAQLQWEHPVRGPLGPETFVPLAEEFGLVTELGHFLVEHCCAQLRTWRDDRGQWGHVSLDLWPTLFRPQAASSLIGDALYQHEVPGYCLEVELTEALAIRRVEETSQVVAEIRSLGVRVALDHFGAAQSSLADLHRLELSTLKIDQSIVARLGKDPRASATADLIVKLGRMSNLEVVGDGVETEVQHNALAQLGCHYGQGEFYGGYAAPGSVSFR